VGVETSKYPAQEVFFIAVLGPEEAGRLGRPGRFDGYDVRAYAYDSRVYAGLVKPAAAAEDQFMAALLEFAGLAGTVAKPQAAEDADSLIFDITAAISRNPEFRNARTQEYISSDGKACLLIRTDEVMLEKLTFADSTEKNMEAVLAEACAEFKRHPSFAGFAIHHYKSYKELCEKDSQ
jgi:hypothetical protein